MSRLIHLNGPPGIGKSTLARRYAAEHPGVLNCDIDVLRRLIGGWQDGFGEAGALIRPAALAMITAYLTNGHDVVMPQMILRPDELERFEASAHMAGADFVLIVLMDSPEAVVARFRGRGAVEQEDEWHRQVQAIVDAEGGDNALRRFVRALESLLSERPDARVINTAEGAVDEAYAAVVEVLAGG